jgi:hypothetical protein
MVNQYIIKLICRYCNKVTESEITDGVYFCSDMCFRLYTGRFNIVFDRNFMKPGLHLTVIDERDGKVHEFFDENFGEDKK